MKWIIGTGILSVCVLALSFLNFGDNIVYFYTPKEALARTNSTTTIKVGGLVQKGSIGKFGDAIKFVLTDNEVYITVVYNGIPPDMFKENQGVVVEGRFDKNFKGLVAKNLMVKHSEEYKKPGDHSTMNKVLLEKSFKFSE